MNEWIKVKKYNLNEAKDGTGLVINQTKNAFTADDFDKNVQVSAKNGKIPASFKGVPVIDRRTGKPVYAVTITGTYANPDRVGNQYYADENGKPVLAYLNPKGKPTSIPNEDGLQPVWNYTRTRSVAGSHRDQWISRKSTSQENPNVNTSSTRIALEKYIRERVDAKNLKSSTDGIDGGEGMIRGIVPTVFAKIFYETNDTRSRASDKVEDRRIPRQVFIDNPFNMKELGDRDENNIPVILKDMYITYSDVGSDGEDALDEENTTSIADAVEIEIDIARQDLESFHEEDAVKKELGDDYADTNAGKKINADIYDNKRFIDGIEVPPFNPNGNLTRHYKPSPELNQYIDKLLAHYSKSIEGLGDNERNNFDNTVADLRKLNEIEFTNGWREWKKNSTRTDRNGKEIKTQGGWVIVKPYKEPIQNAKLYVMQKLSLALPDIPKEGKRENTPEETENIRSYVENLITDNRYKGIIMQTYRIDEPTFNKIISDMFNGGGMTESRKINEGEQLYDKDYDTGKLVPIDASKAGLYAYDAAGNMVKTGKKAEPNLSGDRKLRNQIKHWLSLKVSDYTDINHLKLDIQSQLLPPVSATDMNRIKKMILSVQKREFPGVELSTSEMSKWVKNYDFVEMSDDELASAIRKEVFGTNKVKSSIEKPQTGTPVPQISKTLQDMVDEYDPDGDIVDEDDITALEVGFSDGNRHKPLSPKQMSAIESRLKKLVASNSAMKKDREDLYGDMSQFDRGNEDNFNPTEYM
jgi:hypothetical protein